MSLDEATGPLNPRRLRRIILEQSHRANVGHIGSALSVVEILAAVYGGGLRISSPGDPERDRVILSKGHAALALYAALHLKGWLTAADLDRYCSNGSYLGVHPEHALPGVDFTTGSLGHGLSIGAGAALAARLQGSDRRVAVLVSDAECNEGSLWEAVMFAAHHRLSHLVASGALNGQQALGYTSAVRALEPLARRWDAVGWEVREVDGHDVGALRDALAVPPATTGTPRVVIARTTFGKGVSFMQSLIKWHYWPLSQEEYRRALQDVEDGG